MCRVQVVLGNDAEHLIPPDCACSAGESLEVTGEFVALAELERRIKNCRQCERSLAKYGVAPRPIFGGGTDYPIFLVGQAPGRTEYERNAPFQGDAGKSIKALFTRCGLYDFDRNVYQTSVTKCFPGRLPSASTDRMPSAGEVANCVPFLAEQLELVRPKLVVCLGGLSWKAFLSMQELDQPGFCSRELGIGKPADVKVPDVVGRRFTWRNMLVLPMIHPAGSANGSRAKHPDHDRRSKDLLRASFVEIGVRDL